MKLDRRFVFAWIIVFLAAVFLGAYFFSPKRVQPEATQKKLQVVVTFYPLQQFAQDIGQDYVDVHNLTPAGSEPHDFEPTPQDLVRLHSADVIVYNGAGLEPWMIKLRQELGDKVIVETSKSVQLLQTTEHGTDPHVWLDPLLAIQQVDLIANAFVQTDPAHKEQYLANAKNLKLRLQDLDKAFQQDLAGCQTRTIVTSHNAFQYLAKRYNLQVKSISGLSPDEEPTAQKLAEVVDFVKAQGITHIFFETLVSPKLADTLAQETGTQTLVFNPLEGLTTEEFAEGKNYFTIQRENIAALRTALRCQ